MAEKICTTQEFLREPDEEDPLAIPTNLIEYMEKAPSLDKDTISRFITSTVLSPLLKELWGKHEQLQYLPPSKTTAKGHYTQERQHL